MTTKTATITEPELRMIELSKLDPNPWQPRKIKITAGDIELQDLRDSIKAVGQKTPIRVRPHPTMTGHFQIADGAMRFIVQKSLGRKDILAIVETLTDRQMKILALAQNVFVRLNDTDKEEAIFALYESEFKAKEGRGEFPGVLKMEQETGIDQARITHVLQAYRTRQVIMRSAYSKDSVKIASSRDMETVAPLAKDNPKAAAAIIKARAEDAIESTEIRDVVKRVMAAPMQEREEVARDLIETREAIEREAERKRKESDEAKQKTREKEEATRKAREKEEAEEFEMVERKRAQEAAQSRLKVAENIVETVNRTVQDFLRAKGQIESTLTDEFVRPAIQYTELAQVVRSRRVEAKKIAEDILKFLTGK